MGGEEARHQLRNEVLRLLLDDAYARTQRLGSFQAACMRIPAIQLSETAEHLILQPQTLMLHAFSKFSSRGVERHCIRPASLRVTSHIAITCLR